MTAKRQEQLIILGLSMGLNCVHVQHVMGVVITTTTTHLSVPLAMGQGKNVIKVIKPLLHKD